MDMQQTAQDLRAKAPAPEVRDFFDEYSVAADAVLIVLAADLQSTAWKYTDKRSYRSVILDAGHLNQNIYLVGTSLGLAVGTTAVQRDEDFEIEFGLSPALKVPLMLTGIGHHRDLDALTARVPTPLEQ